MILSVMTGAESTQFYPNRDIHFRYGGPFNSHGYLHIEKKGKMYK